MALLYCCWRIDWHCCFDEKKGELCLPDNVGVRGFFLSDLNLLLLCSFNVLKREMKQNLILATQKSNLKNSMTALVTIVTLL